MIGELITAGAGLLGSLFGKKKKEQTETTINYVKMAQNAEAAGFNPLTALRNGGSAGFTSTVHHPGLSGVAESIGQIGGVLGSALEKRMDPIEQKRDKVESALLDYQLATIQAGPKVPQSFGNVPTKKGQPRMLQTVPPMASSSRVQNGSAVPAMKFKAGDNPTVSTVGLEDRFGITSDPYTADASAWEQRYAEPGEWVGGIYVMGADAIYNAKRKLTELSDGGKAKGKDGLTPAERVYKNGTPLREGLAREINGILPSWTPTDKQIGDWFGLSSKVKKGGRVAPPSTR